MQNFSYDSDLVGGSLMVRESRIIAGLLLEDSPREVWDHEILEENLLQKRSPASARRNAQAIRKRLERLDPSFWRALRDGDEELAIQVAFCAALERNLLLVEFIEQVVSAAYRTHIGKLELYLWADFLEDCAQKDFRIRDWKESSKNKMGQVVFRILAEMGYLENSNSMRLQRVIIRPELKMMLENTSRQRIKACMEVSLRVGG